MFENISQDKLYDKLCRNMYVKYSIAYIAKNPQILIFDLRWDKWDKRG